MFIFMFSLHIISKRHQVLIKNIGHMQTQQTKNRGSPYLYGEKPWRVDKTRKQVSEGVKWVIGKENAEFSGNPVTQVINI